VSGVKKRLLVTIVLVVGLLVVGCSSTSTSSTTSSTLESTTGSITTTSTGPDEGSTASSSTSTTAAVTSTTAATAKATRYEQNDPHLVYSGTWKTSANAAASGGTYTFANAGGAKVTIRFVGTRLSLIAKKSSRYGKANITLDGKTLGAIDLYNIDAAYQKKVWGTGTLKPGTHTVVIVWTGTKRTAATDTNINIDCVLVTGTLK
jgi:hypothetical protein